MKVTINDIARAAGVSKSTVSKVLNDAPTIPETTKQKIREIMKELNYIPSSIATQLAKQKTFNIVLLIDLSRKDAFLNHFFYDIIGGIESVIGPQNYELTICNIQSLGEVNVLHRYVLNRKSDGLILDNSILTPEIAEELNDRDFPYVLLGEWIDTGSTNWVDIDNRRGGDLLASHLIEKGYRKIAFIGGEQDEPIFSSRYGGMRAALERSGIPFREIYKKCGYASEDNGYRFMRELLDLNVLPDAAICMNNPIAFGVLRAIREQGLSIPDEFGLAAFDNYPLAPYTTPPLTCLDIDTFELGVAAGQMLMNRINQDDGAFDHQWIVSKLIERESTARNGKEIIEA